MAISTNKSQNAPYFDDYVKSGVEDKNYLRILFKPGVAVQARELNQLQTTLQGQIDKFGRNIFKDNSRVLDGSFSINRDVKTIDVAMNVGYQTETQITQKLLGKAIRDTDTDVTATVLGFENIAGNNYKLFVRYTKTKDSSLVPGSVASIADNQSTADDSPTGTFQTPIYKKVFSDLSVLFVPTGIGSVETAFGTVNATGHAIQYKIDKGVFFVLGSFVVCESQEIFVDLGPLQEDGSSLTYSGQAILLATEGTADVSTDPTLNDNALGTPNVGAPGADRYTIDLALRLLTDNSVILNSSFNTNKALQKETFNGTAVKLTDIVFSAAVDDYADQIEYNKIATTMAQRTFEESGNYTLNPVSIDLREHLNDGSNGGRFLADDPIVPGLQEKLIVDVEPNTAYVGGTRISYNETISIEMDKARDTFNSLKGINSGERVVFQANTGNYILADSIRGVFDSTVDYELYESKAIFDSNSPSTRIGPNSPTIAIGTCKVSNVEFDGSKFRVYIESIDMTQGFEFKDASFLANAGTRTGDDASTYLAATTGGDFEVDAGSKSSGFRLLETHKKADIFPIGRSAIKDVQKLFYTERTTSIALTRAGGGTSVELSLTDSQGVGSTASNWFSDNPNDYIIIQTATGLVLPHSTTPSITNNASTVTLTLDSATQAGFHEVKVISSKRVQADLTQGKKTIFVNNEVLGSNQSSITKNQRFLLTRDPDAESQGGGSEEVTDAFKIVSASITGVNANAATDGTNTRDITNELVLDPGQTDNSYGQSSVIYVGPTLALSSGTITVEYKYFVHTANGPFTIESYPVNGNLGFAHTGGAANTLLYDDVPAYAGVDLSDVIDFRGVTLTNVDPNSVMVANIDYYLGRKSLLSLTNAGNYIITDGPSSQDPIMPEPPEGAVPLYEFTLAPYTKNKGKGLHVHVNERPHRRFTMRDINTIDQRVKNLEYYTSLTLLETEANNKQIFDNEGEKFKNGILVDSFTGHNVGNPFDPGYNMAIDFQKKEARPAYELEYMNIFLANRNPGDAFGLDDRPEEAARLPGETSEPLVSQMFASTAINVNKYGIASYFGDLTLSPSTDEWKSIERLEKLVTNFDNNYDHLLADFTERNKNRTGLQWDEYTYQWSGVTSTTHYQHHSDREWKGYKGYETQRDTSINVWHTKTGTKSREGIETLVTTREAETSLGDRLIRTSYRPLMRSKKIYFKAEGMKPNTRVIPFFDRINVDVYCRQADFIEYINGTNNQNYEPLTNNKVGGLKASDVLQGAGDPGLTTDANGYVSGYFFLPNNEELSFTSGAKLFRLVDSVVEHDPNVQTSAEAIYRSQGRIDTYQEQAISYKTPILETTRVSSGPIAVYDSYKVSSKKVGGHQGTNGAYVTANLQEGDYFQGCYVDPLAQSFVAPKTSYPNGVFLRDIDLYFQTIGSDADIKIHLVTMRDGVPTGLKVPDSTVRLTAADMVNKASEDATIKTNFRFARPVHIAGGVEYAVIVTSNSDGYKLWHATTGQNDLTGNVAQAANDQFKINLPPYLGVSFISKNQSTWDADQQTVFKMQINIMRFQTGVTIDKNFTSILPQDSSGSTLEAAIPCTHVVLNSNDAIPAGCRIRYILLQNTGAREIAYPIIPHETIQLPSQITNINDAKDLTVRAILETGDAFLTPMIDLERTSLLLLNNVIGNAASIGDETLRSHGGATSRYLTRKVNLENPANKLDVFVDLCKPEGTDVKVFVRADTLSDGANTTNKFEEMTGIFPVNSSGDDRNSFFTEAHFEFDLQKLLNNKVAGGTTPGGFATKIIEFKEFEVKIVFTSEDAAIVPKMKNLRCIATT